MGEALGILAVLAVLGLAGIWVVLWCVRRWEGGE